MTTTPARKYNPGFLSDEELVASFCVRTHEFESLIEMLRDCTGNSNRHQIVIGPRGSGKTSLLLRVAAEVRRDADLAANFFPIVFAEESYEVSTAGEFWLECLARLAHQAPQREYAPDLLLTVADLRTIQDDQLLGERCLAAVLDFSEREGKRLVLMVENLNMMFRDMMDPDAGWRLRKILQTEPRIILLASATSRFDEIDHPDHALYDQFRVLTLRPLNTAECAVLWETVAGQSRPPNTVRSLEILTGGSPRLLAIVARFGAGLSFRELMDSLFDLVDDHTEYFKSHLESLPPQERRVYLALAELWKPALAKEVAQRTRLETSKCSAHLARLVARGVVRLDGGSARRKQYYLSERMYNIYYLMRRGPDRLVEVLVRFMASYYSSEELEKVGALIALEAEDAAPEMQPLHQSASAKLMATSSTDVADEVTAARGLSKEGLELWDRSQYSDALETFDELLRRFGQTEAPELLVEVATALTNKGAVLDRLSRREEALAIYDEVLVRFSNSKSPRLVKEVAETLFNKGFTLRAMGKPKEALNCYEEILCCSEDKALEAMTLINKGVTLRALDEHEKALEACEEVFRRFDDRESAGLIKFVAQALFNKGVTLGAMNRRKEELAVYDEVLRRFGDSEVPELLKQVAKSLVNKGIALDVLGQREKALTTYDQVRQRFEGSAAPELLEQVVNSLVNKSIVLTKLNRPAERSDVDVLLALFPKLDSSEQAIRALVISSIGHSPTWMHELIQASPAAASLRPLTTALEREMGLDPRVPEEISEVAEDIRRNLARMKEKHGLGT